MEENTNNIESIEPKDTELSKEELKANKKAEKKAAKEAQKKAEKKEQKEFAKWKAEKEAAALAEAEEEHGLYYTKKEPRKALSTFFRNQNKVLVSSMAIADRKAMIMIRINSLLVTVIMVFYRYIDHELAMGWLIALLLIIGTGLALVFAVLAARPNGRAMHKITVNEIETLYPNLEERNFWVGPHVSLDEYEQSMDKLVNSQELQIGSQVRFNYVIEKYLSNKWRLLDIAYNLFLGSFVLATIVFVVSRIVFHYG